MANQFLEDLTKEEAFLEVIAYAARTAISDALENVSQKLHRAI
jgi:hypothetical protein